MVAALGILALLIATALLSSAYHRGNRPGAPAGARRVTNAEVAMAQNTWLISDDEYLRQFPPAKKADSKAVAAAPAVAKTVNGPAAQRLLALTLGAGPSVAGLDSSSRELVDEKVASTTIATVSFTYPDGRLVTATQEQLPRPLPRGALRITNDEQIQYTPSGSAVVVVQTPDTAQVVLVTKAGLMTQITARGILAQDVPPPFTVADLHTIMMAVDTAIAAGK
ncbi:hypothetical protein AB0J80_34425 [Actinoplanes sp. NPDC049548]|uniref:hypothetical protein n=1 Tax=Actinoplanes sp. NPDC049548 TaxID=3155152 RepID=UPI0034144963